MGSFWGQFGYPNGVTSASLLARESDFVATLELFFTYDDDFVATSGALSGHFWHLRTALGALWADFGATWGALAAYGGDFGGILGSLWGQFGYLWVTLGQLMVSLQ